ncbi:L-idonate 5-dehydrogenase [Mesorhizobium sp. 1M-11]|uniref:L-idonate 5-dehydrogenase n=1 Tax=Mesorhizobium sp. 1M-11 TaxID=1529006 RepID=UPI0006C74644|nr:L-idonate 5-dehydrogenase [Mesorhizobium sp. 1M-11]
MSSAYAATLFGPEDLRVVERDLGALLPGMVRVRLRAGGICGSDMHYFRHARTGDFIVTSPLVLGHEVAGEVVEINGRADGLAIGDHVAVNPSRWCGTCVRCREGRPNLCENIYFMGSASKTPHMQGGFSTLFDATPAQCVKVPENLPFAAAALAEPLAVALHAVARAGNIEGRHVALFGAGPIGLLSMLAARLGGADRITMVDIAAQPLAFAKTLGADRVVDIGADQAGLADVAAVDPIDVGLEVSGTAAGLASAIRTVRRGGTVVLVGNLPGGEISVPANAIMAKELDVRGTFRFGEEFRQAVERIISGAVDVQRLITATRPLAEAPEAFRLALDRGRSIKVILTGD